MSKIHYTTKVEIAAISLAVGLSLLIFGAFIWAMIELFSMVIELIN